MNRRLAGPQAPAAGAFFTLASVMAAHALIETARDALFFTSLPASHLAWVYLAIAAGSLLVARTQRALERLQSHRALGILLAACGAVTLGFWQLSGSASAPMFYALYIWAGLYVTVVILQFWVVVSETFTIARAKRAYAIIGAGGTIGAMAGSAAARVIVDRRSPRDLLLVAGGLLIVSGAAARVVLARSTAEPARDGRSASGPAVAQIQRLGSDPYLARLAGLVLLSTVALTVADYLYKSEVARAIEPARLGAFFATANLALNALALFAQLVVVGWLLRVVGVIRALTVLPALLLVGGVGVAVGGGLIAALVLVGAGGALRFSVHTTATELLYLPLADQARSRARAVIESLSRRGGQALASFGILAVAAAPGSAVILGLAVAALAAAWIAVTLNLKRHYLDLFRATLRRGAMPTRVEAPPLDMASLEQLVAALDSHDDAEVLGALDLLEAEDRTRAIPSLILFHPSRAVVLRALTLFEEAGRDNVVATIDRMLDHTDAEVRAAALRARSALRPDPSILRVAIHDKSAAVRVTALVGLASHGWMDEAELEATLDAMTRKGPPEARLALASALRHQPVAAFESALVELARAPETAVQLEAVHAMGESRNERFLPELRAMLANREIRTAAREALVAVGSSALPFLERSLQDLTLPDTIRHHLPRTISRFPAASAAPILLGRLLHEPDGTVRFKILRGLGRLRANHRDLRLDPGILRAATDQTLAGAFCLLDWRLALERGAAEDPSRATPGGELLLALLRDRESKAVERLFRLLGLTHLGEDFARVHRGVGAPDPRARAGSRELLEYTLRPPLRESVIGLVDDLTDAERLVHGPPFYTPEHSTSERLDPDAVLDALLERGGESLRCLAAYHVGELGLDKLAPRLEALRNGGSRLTTEVVERALELLNHAGKEAAPK